MNEEGLGFCSIPFCFGRFKVSDILGSWNLTKQTKVGWTDFFLNGIIFQILKFEPSLARILLPKSS